MTTSMLYIEPIIVGLKEKGIATKVVIGGAPISQKFADKINADGYAKDAIEAVRMIKNVVGA